MYREIRYEDLCDNKIDGSYVLIDVRSPGEFNSETIPGAVNIPIFSDAERAEIGTAYMQESVDKAKKLGIEAASRNLPEIYEKVTLLEKKYDNLIFFCARGGFRSSSLVSLFMTLSVHSIKLDGGYKGYRKYINDQLPSLIEGVRFVVLYGNTGVGKTDILKALSKKGMDILDLEGYANHRGSLLGSVGLDLPNTQKMFESLLFEALSKIKSNLVFIEGESKRIGRIILPDYLFAAMNNGIKIKIDAAMDNRIDNIYKEYVHDTDEELLEALDHLRKNLGEKKIDMFKSLIQNKEYREVIKELMISYYDPLYEYKKREFIATFINEDSNKTANNLVEFIKSQDIIK